MRSTLAILIPALAVAALAVAPLVAPTTQVLLTLALAKALAVLEFIVLLQAGQVSFGHALYFAVAAYVAAFIGRATGGGALVVTLIGGVAAATVLGFLVGVFVVRYRHIVFGMLNLSVSMIFSHSSRSSIT